MGYKHGMLLRELRKYKSQVRIRDATITIVMVVTSYIVATAPHVWLVSIEVMGKSDDIDNFAVSYAFHLTCPNNLVL